MLDFDSGFLIGDFELPTALAGGSDHQIPDRL